jgi:hypothetical protein
VSTTYFQGQIGATTLAGCVAADVLLINGHRGTAVADREPVADAANVEEPATVLSSFNNKEL